MQPLSKDDNYKGHTTVVALSTSAATYSAIITVALGILVLIGWYFNITALKSLSPHLASLKANTALGFILLGMALLLQLDTTIGRALGRARLLIARICAAVVIVMACATLGEHVWDWHLGLDEFLFKDFGDRVGAGRIPLMSTINFILLGVVLLLLDVEASYSRHVNNLLSGIAASLSFFALLGYVYGLSVLYSGGAFGTIAVHAATLFLVLSLGCLWARPTSGFMRLVSDDSNSGLMLRRMLPATILVPALVGWIILLGQKLGFYTFEFSLVIHMAASAVIFSSLLWLLARRMKRMDIERLQIQEESTWQQAILNSADLAIISTDLSGIIRTCNRGILHKLGYRADEIIGQVTPVIFIDSNELEQRAQYLSRQTGQYVSEFDALIGQARQGNIEKREWTCIHKNGTRSNIYLSITSMYDEAGQPNGFLSIGKDITSQRSAERQSEKASADLQKIIDQMPAIVTYWDKQLCNRLGNKAYEEWFGIAPESLRGQHMQHVIGETRYQQLKPKLISVLKGNTEVFERMITSPDHPSRHALFSYVPDIVNGEVKGMYGFITDISLLKQAQTEKIRALETLQSMIDAASEFSIITTTPEGLITLFSRGAEDMLGYTATDMVDKNTPALIHVAEEIQARGEALTRELGCPIQGFEVFIQLPRQGVAETREWTYVRQDGTTLPVNLTVTAVRDQDGGIMGYLGIAKDIRDDIAVRQALADARDHAETASHAKSQFLANMSHEIRTPMNAILGMVQLLMQTELTHRQMDYTSKTQIAAKSLLGLLNDILDFSKVEAGKLTLDIHSFRIDKLMRDLAVILSTSTEGKDVEILLDIDKNLPLSIHGDSLRLQQILINLAGNAVKFTEQGEVVVKLSLVALSAQRVDIEFSVRDTGIGIAEDQLHNIFEGFAQAEASTTRRFGGTGLGLGISKRLVSLMGGELHVESTLGVGSRFYFSVPFLPTDDMDVFKSKYASSELKGLTTKAPMRVLIVDDNETAREVLQNMVESIGWVSETVESGALALAHIEHASDAGMPYDVVFMDWRMPDMDGWQTTCNIRNMSDIGQSPVIIMVTAHDRELLAERLRNNPIALDGFLVKPITASMLFDTVAEAKANTPGIDTKVVNQPASKRLIGLNLLVVEDNEINQQIAYELLRNEGAQVAVANNGRRGVEAVLAAQPLFDVVLMDIQMPVLDGYGATAEIRSHAQLQALPIIAMTANALESDKEACLAAGMNDHIGKPIDLDALVNTILHHAKKQTMTVSYSSVVTESATDNQQNIQQDNQHPLQRALQRLGYNQSLFISMSSKFIHSTTTLASELQQYWQLQQKDSAMRLLHTLKGTASTVGAMDLVDFAADLERQLKAVDQLTDIKFDVESFNALIQRSGDELTTFTQMLKANAPVSQSTSNSQNAAEISQILDKLDNLLRRKSMRATQVFTELQKALGERYGAELTALEQDVINLDFKHALDKTQTLRELIQ